MGELKIRRWVAMRRRWPYWNWVVWERVTGPWTETLIVDQGLTFRRSTADQNAADSIAHLEVGDEALRRNLADTHPGERRG
jgi:hypothetical protein